METFREPTPVTKKKKITQLSSMVSQLKEIVETTNSTVEEHEFEIFGKHVGLQLKSLPLLLALEAQEHIQLYLNRIRRQHLQNASEQNRSSRTPESPYYATESSCSDASIYCSGTTDYNLQEQATESISSSILPTHHSEHVESYQITNMFPSGHVNNNETQRNATIISNDVILTAMQNANVDNKK